MKEKINRLFDNEEGNTLKVLIIVLIIFGILSAFYNFVVKEKNNDNDSDIVDNTNNVSIVTNHNKFYTVSSCVSKYINYLTAKDTDNLLILLSEEYQKTNNINSNNVYNYTGTINGNKSFSANKMFSQKINQNIYKYYVYGNLREETLNYTSEKEDFYLIVFLNDKDMTFAVEPYNGDIFR